MNFRLKLQGFKFHGGYQQYLQVAFCCFFLTPHPLVCPQNLAPTQSQESQVLRQQFERRMRTRNTHAYSELDRFIWGPTRGKVTSSAITVEQKPTASARNDPN